MRQYNPHTLIHGILIYLNNYVLIRPLTMIATDNTAIDRFVYITVLKRSYKTHFHSVFIIYI